jgi:hypothetical protein
VETCQIGLTRHQRVLRRLHPDAVDGGLVPRPLCQHPWRVVGVLQQRPCCEGEGFSVQTHPLVPIDAGHTAQQRIEPVEVEHDALGTDPVGRGLGHDEPATVLPVCSETAPEQRHVRLERGGDVLRGPVRPQPVSQPLPAHRPAPCQEEHLEQRLRLAAAELARTELPVRDVDAEGAEQVDGEGRFGVDGESSHLGVGPWRRLDAHVRSLPVRLLLVLVQPVSGSKGRQEVILPTIRSRPAEAPPSRRG